MKVKKCVGCGYCCMKTPCDVARRLYPGATVCPQLIWTDERYECGLMKISGPLGADYRNELHAGAGCCCGLNTWRNDVKKRVQGLNRTALNPLPEIMQIFLRSLSKEFISSDSIYLAICGMQADLAKRNYAEEDIEAITKNIAHAFTSNRTSFNEGFMG